MFDVAMNYQELSAIEENAVVRSAMAGNRAAMNKLINSIIPLIKKQASKFHCSAISMDDLINEGVLGAYKAFKEYDVNSGILFRTYAIGNRGWVFQFMQQAVWNSHLIGMSVQDRKEGKLHEHHSFDSPVFDDEGVKFSDVIATPELEEEKPWEDAGTLYEMIEKMPSGMEKEIITRFASDMSCREIGRELNVSHQTPNRYREKAIAMLKKMAKCRTP